MINQSPLEIVPDQEQYNISMPPLPNGLTSLSFGNIGNTLCISSGARASLPRRTLIPNNNTISSDNPNASLQPQFEVDQLSTTRLEALPRLRSLGKLPPLYSNWMLKPINPSSPSMV